MEIVKKDDIEAVKFGNSAVAVICYTLTENNVLAEIGVVKETNPHFNHGYSENIIMGTIEKSDTSLLFRAMTELKEEAGLEETDPQRWSFLGKLYTSKVSPDPVYLFAVNVTGKTPQVAAGDGKGEKIISFSLTPIEKALEIEDSILIAAFFRLFMKIYKKDLTTNN